MKKDYDSLDASLNIESSIIEVEKVKENLNIKPLKSEDIQKDYEIGRAHV